MTFLTVAGLTLLAGCLAWLGIGAMNRTARPAGRHRAEPGPAPTDPAVPDETETSEEVEIQEEVDALC